ncbi:MAG: bifunctional diaminohydroxyphosphoribosylaminopyrimidine deaminase/5-amino-6-(5-phosphoribosylamino)uracil reductase RibD [Bacteroidales bacterium]|nr:bifunctional diaminohydroxyphosphoribosylaminopyrimidine deaminase/5-amino-6-(5-phosphoribosylamino)uracil reductase RibD [Bacteroidales bacterium]
MRAEEKYMKRCLELAQLASGNTAPNPMVGSVVVHQGRIIGEGYHQLYGQAHAEANAIRSVKDRSLLPASTLYVNLEPCSHHGNTPPCSELIVEEGIPRVVIGSIDTSSRVSGRGIQILKEGGCEVRTGVLEGPCRYLNRRFFTYHERQRPYVILKWAQTVDGFLDKERRKEDPIQPIWITNDVSRHLVHKWRSEEQAILVGSRTALKDNPSLNVREWHGKDPLRLLIDRDLEIDETYRMVHDELPLVVFTGQNSDDAREQELSRYKVEVVRLDFETDPIPQIFDYLYQRKILSVFVEGGRYTLHRFLDTGQWDEARVFMGNRMFHSGVKAPSFPAVASYETTELKDTRLYWFRNG